MQVDPPAFDPQEAVRSLRQFGAALRRLPEHLHPAWREKLLRRVWPIDERAAAALAMPTFTLLCGPVPREANLRHPVGRWCLLPAPQLAQRLAVLALSRRPGALRGCIRRSDREALARLAGPALEPLNALLPSATLLAGGVGDLSAEAWAWSGYLDLMHQRAWPERCLRRWARLSLPPCAPSNWRAVTAPSAILAEVGRVDRWLGDAPAAA